MRILTLTPNPAVDAVLLSRGLEWGETLWAESSRRVAGGKGINMARVAVAMGHQARAVFLGGGPTGRFLCEELELAGVEPHLVNTNQETRTNMVVRDPSSGRTLKVNERGAAITQTDANNFLEAVVESLPGARAVALGGSMPPGMTDADVEALAQVIARAGVTSLIDVPGEWLNVFCREGKPSIVKPNKNELAAALDRSLGSEEEVVAAGRELVSLGATQVIITDGPRAAFCVTEHEVWKAHPAPITGSAMAGMGDACGVGYLLAQLDGMPVKECFQQAMAYGSAVASAPEAELLNADLIDLAHRAIHLEKIS
jgi:1-phosphofructokinase